MNPKAWNITMGRKARLDAPLAATDARVVAAVERLTQTPGGLGELRGAFRSTAMRPEAGVPIFGLVAACGVLVLGFAVWLPFGSPGGVAGFVERKKVGGVIAVAVLLLMGLGLLAFGGLKIRTLLRDLGQLLLVFDNALVNIRFDGTDIFTWNDVKEIQHQAIAISYDGMDTGTEHAFTVTCTDGRELVLLGRTYPKPPDEPAEPLMTDVGQVGEFVSQRTPDE